MLERRDGDWRIVLREFLPEMRFTAPSNYDVSGVPPFARGTWDTKDISYVRPLPRRADSERVMKLPEPTTR
ncbi:MAG TPA: hypothetical protein VI759_05990 [Dehalococcoidia bacterium]|nr:hypothetical protein [Dehalococcoidia bacterium]